MRVTTPRPAVVLVSDGDGPPRLVRAEHAVKALTVRVDPDGTPRVVVEWKAARPRRGKRGKPTVRRVRTPEGARRYGQPIGAVIVVDPDTGAVQRLDGSATGASTRGRVTPAQAQAAAGALGPERTQRIVGRAGLSGATPAALRRLVDEASAGAADDDETGPDKAPGGRSEWGPGRSPARATADFTFDSTAAVDARTPTNNALRHHFVNQPGYTAVDDADVDGVTYRPGDVVSYRDRDGRTAHEGRVLALRRGGPRDEVQAYVQWDAGAAPDGPSGESVLPLTVDAARVTKVSDGDGGVGPDDATEGAGGGAGGEPDREPGVDPGVQHRALTASENAMFAQVAQLIAGRVRVHDGDDGDEVASLLGAAVGRDTRAVEDAFADASDYLRMAAANSVVRAKIAEYEAQAEFIDRSALEFRRLLGGGEPTGGGRPPRRNVGKPTEDDVEKVPASRLLVGDTVLLDGIVYDVRGVGGDDDVPEGVLRLTVAESGVESVVDVDPSMRVNRIPAGAYRRGSMGATDRTGDGAPDVTPPGPPPPDPEPEPVAPPRPPRRRTTTGGGRAGGGAPRRWGVPEGQSRPLLYTYQRRNLVALNLDEDGNQSPLVREAAAAVRARRPLTAEQSTALALAVRAAASRDGVRPVQARALGRLAQRLDAASAEARGMSAGDVASRIDLSVKPKAVKPGDTGSGDRVAVAGPDGTLVQGVIRSTRSIMGGRLVEIDVEGDDGTVTRVLHTARTDAFLLPDLPDPEPVVSLPEREMVVATSVRAGDTIRVMQGGRHYDVEVESVVTTGGLLEVAHVDPRPGRSGGSTTFLDRSALVTRVTRGDASRSQPPGIPFTEGDPVDTPWRDVRVGDRVVIPGDEVQGMVTRIEEMPRRGSTPARTRLHIADDGGGKVYLDVSGDRMVPVQSRGAGGVEAAIRAMVEEEARRADAARVAASIGRELRRALDRGPAADIAVTVNRAEALSVIDRHARNTNWAVISRRAAAFVAQDLFNGTGADEEARREAAEEPLRAFMESALRDEFADLRRAYEAAEPMPGETDTDAVRRVLSIDRQQDRSARWETTARALLQGRDYIRQGAPMDAPPPPPAPPRGGSLADRMAAYRQALGGTFGRSQQRVVTFDALDVESLRRGEIPSTVTRTVGRRGRAADGGPDETAMRHLAVVRAAGAELRSAVDAEMNAALVGVLRDNPVEGVELRDGESAAALIARMEREYIKASDAWTDALHVGGAVAERTARDAARARRDSVKRAAAEARRRAVMLTIGSVREIGGEQLDYVEVTARADTTNPAIGDALTERDRLVRAMRTAEAIYPSDWIASVRDNVQGRFGRSLALGETSRGFATQYGVVTLSSGTRNRVGGGDFDHVAVHELGHQMENSLDGMVEAEEAFLWSRTATGEVGSRTLEPLVHIPGDKPDARSRRDRLPHIYTGRIYSDGGGGRGRENYELFTTGIESLVAGSPYQDGDTDFQDWTLGVLALLGNPRPPSDTVEDVTADGQRVTLRAAPEPGPAAAEYRNPFVDDPADRAAVEQNLRDVFGFTHDKSGFTIDMETPTSESDRATVSFIIRDKDGNRVGDGSRTVIKHADGRVEVHHDLLTLNPEVQGQGFADAYYKHLYDQYPSMGVTHVTINANIDIGGYCVPMRAQCLTRDGWKKYDEIVPGVDETLGWDAATGTMRWTPIAEVLTFDDLQFHRFAHRDWAITATGEHRMVTSALTTRDGKPHWTPHVLAPLSDMMTAAGGVKNGRRLLVSAPLDADDRSGLTPDQAALLGWLVTDGWVTSRVRAGRTAVEVCAGIGQEKKSGRAAVTALLGRLGGWGGHWSATGTYVPAATLRGLYAALGRPYGASLKDGLSDVVVAMGSAQVSAFADAAYAAEGQQTGGRRRFWQNPGPVLDACHLAFFLTGCRVTPPRSAAGKSADSFAIGRPHVTSGRMVRTNEGRGPAWCVRTGLGSWVMHLDGHAMLTGNSWSQRGFGWDDPQYGPGPGQGSDIQTRLGQVPRSALDAATPEQRQRLTDFQETLRRARYGEGPWPSPKEIANAVADLEWEHTTAQGVKVRMWPGKWAMLGSDWYGTYYLPGNERAMAENRARFAAARERARAAVAARAAMQPPVGADAATVTQRLRAAGVRDPERVVDVLMRQWAQAVNGRATSAMRDPDERQRHLAAVWARLMDDVGL